MGVLFSFLYGCLVLLCSPWVSCSPLLFDPEVGLYFYRARVHDALLGRFLSRDPIGYDAGSEVLYEYVHGAPLDQADPSGLRSCQARYDACLKTSLKGFLACGKRAEFVCAIACLGSRKVFRHPACLTCILGYTTACNTSYACNQRWCNTKKRECLCTGPSPWLGGVLYYLANCTFEDPWPDN